MCGRLMRHRQGTGLTENLIPDLKKISGCEDTHVK